MFREKIINASSNLKMSLHLKTKIKSNRCLDIGTEVIHKFLFLIGVDIVSWWCSCGIHTPSINK